VYHFLAMGFGNNVRINVGSFHSEDSSDEDESHNYSSTDGSDDGSVSSSSSSGSSSSSSFEERKPKYFNWRKKRNNNNDDDMSVVSNLSKVSTSVLSFVETMESTFDTVVGSIMLSNDADSESDSESESESDYESSEERRGTFKKKVKKAMSPFAIHKKMTQMPTQKYSNNPGHKSPSWKPRERGFNRPRSTKSQLQYESEFEGPSSTRNAIAFMFPQGSVQSSTNSTSRQSHPRRNQNYQQSQPPSTKSIKSTKSTKSTRSLKSTRSARSARSARSTKSSGSAFHDRPLSTRSLSSKWGKKRGKAIDPPQFFPNLDNESKNRFHFEELERKMKNTCTKQKTPRLNTRFFKSREKVDKYRDMPSLDIEDVDDENDSLGTPQQTKGAFWNDVMSFMHEEKKIPDEILITAIPTKKKLFSFSRGRKGNRGRKNNNYASLS
jgi:hypothetical protein